jgi:hypothetical protein
VGKYRNVRWSTSHVVVTRRLSFLEVREVRDIASSRGMAGDGWPTNGLIERFHVMTASAERAEIPAEDLKTRHPVPARFDFCVSIDILRADHGYVCIDD